jgi:tRNA dimethylallyltransferase
LNEESRSRGVEESGQQRPGREGRSPDLLAIVGPTATGKTEVGILVAEVIGGEIISADSMAVYRGMDVATAKPTGEERARVPHHLVDIIRPDEPFSVADYVQRADAAIEEIRGRGRVPIVVGGSGLYVRALIDGKSAAPVPPDRALRARLAEQGVEALYAQLAQVDPEAAARISPADEKRIIRALEVCLTTGEPISRLQALDRHRPPRYNACRFALTYPREELYRRIEARIDRQLAAGLVVEVRGLLARGYGEDLPAMKGLGYAQAARFLRGGCTLAEAVVQLKRDTRRFAKRQMTWFRADRRLRWLDVHEVGGPQAAAQIIEGTWRQGCE